MDLDSLRVFLEVAERGGFAAVARARGIDPSSVSRTVAGMEAELGVRLLQRSTRRMQLTEAGTAFLRETKAVVEGYERARESAIAVSQGPSGKLRVTASVAFGERCLVPLLGSFRAAYPAISLELLLTDQNVDLYGERIDLAVRLGYRMQPEVIGRKLFSTRYRVVASPAYLKKRGRPRIPEDLQRHGCLAFALPEFPSRWRFRSKRGVIHDVPITSDLIVSSALPLRACALQGLGPSLLPDWLIDDDVEAGLLADLFPSYAVTPTEFDTAVWLLYPSRAYLPSKVRVAIDFLKLHLRR